MRSLGFDLDDLVKKKKIAIDYIRIERNEIPETGEFDLDGLFIRLALAIDTVGAQRVVLDTIETLFGGFTNQAVLRSELRRLFRWLKDKKVSCVITGERGDGALTRQGLEEYVSDCVILLDHRVTEQVSTRRLRIVKYRGSVHGTNEYPFLIDERGIAVLPVTEPRPEPRIEQRAHYERRAAARRDARRERLLPRLVDPRERFRRHGQDEPRRALRARDLQARRALPVSRVRGEPEPAHAQHALDRSESRGLSAERHYCRSTRRGRRCSASRRTSCRSTRPSPTSRRPR